MHELCASSNAACDKKNISLQYSPPFPPRSFHLQADQTFLASSYLNSDKPTNSDLNVMSANVSNVGNHKQNGYLNFTTQQAGRQCSYHGVNEHLFIFA